MALTLTTESTENNLEPLHIDFLKFHKPDQHAPRYLEPNIVGTQNNASKDVEAEGHHNRTSEVRYAGPLVSKEVSSTTDVSDEGDSKSWLPNLGLEAIYPSNSRRDPFGIYPTPSPSKLQHRPVDSRVIQKDAQESAHLVGEHPVTIGTQLEALESGPRVPILPDLQPGKGSSSTIIPHGVPDPISIDDLACLLDNVGCHNFTAESSPPVQGQAASDNKLASDPSSDSSLQVPPVTPDEPKIQQRKYGSTVLYWIDSLSQISSQVLQLWKDDLEPRIKHQISQLRSRSFYALELRLASTHHQILEKLRPSIILICTERGQKQVFSGCFSQRAWASRFKKANLKIRILLDTTLGPMAGPGDLTADRSSQSECEQYIPLSTRLIHSSNSEGDCNSVATTGGLIMIDQYPVALSVAHPFQHCLKGLRPLSIDEIGPPAIFSNDDSNDDIAETESVISSSSGSSTGSAYNAKASIYSDEEIPDTESKEPEKYIPCQFLHGQNTAILASTLGFDAFSSMAQPTLESESVIAGSDSGFMSTKVASDWILLQESPDILRDQNTWLHRNGEKYVKFKIKETGLPDPDVKTPMVVLTGHGGILIKQILSTPTTIGLYGCQYTALELDLKYPLARGDSGSWVVQGQRLIGIIVAGSNEIPYAYLLSIDSIFDSIRAVTKAKEIRLPTAEDDLFDLVGLRGDDERGYRASIFIESGPQIINARSQSFVLDQGMGFNDINHGQSPKSPKRKLVDPYSRINDDDNNDIITHSVPGHRLLEPKYRSTYRDRYASTAGSFSSRASSIFSKHSNSSRASDFSYTTSSSSRSYGLPSPLASSSTILPEYLYCQWPNCNTVLRNEVDYMKHANGHMEPFKCKLDGCEKLFSSQNQLERHQISMHRQTWKKQSFICAYPSCQSKKRWARLDNFKVHLRLHLKNTLYSEETLEQWVRISRELSRVSEPDDLDEMASKTFTKRQQYTKQSSRHWSAPEVDAGAEFAKGLDMVSTTPIIHYKDLQPATPNTLLSLGHQYPPVNPADQNPPCNTLYVGNLPLDASEDELKAMFSKQRGYKRLCFRMKQNGPMCFVEFENVSFATKALTELYGAPLQNSVNGGIRLSFSKNPLGLRDPFGEYNEHPGRLNFTLPVPQPGLQAPYELPPLDYMNTSVSLPGLSTSPRLNRAMTNLSTSSMTGDFWHQKNLPGMPFEKSDSAF